MEQSEEKLLISSVPEGAEPIREEEFYRLPDYVHELIEKSYHNELPITTHEEMVEALTSFLESQNCSTSTENINHKITDSRE
jgi:hypothetical protein